MSILSGIEFKKIYGSEFVKIINSEHKHNNYPYKHGLNEDVIPFNPSGTCLPGGLYFTTDQFIKKFMLFGDYVAKVEIPDNAQVYLEPDGNKFKADKIILNLKDKISFNFYPTTAEYLRQYNEIANNLHDSIIHKDPNTPYNPNTSFIKNLLEKTIKSDDIYIYYLRHRLKINEKWLLCYAVEKVHFELVELLLKFGCDYSHVLESIEVMIKTIEHKYKELSSNGNKYFDLTRIANLLFDKSVMIKQNIVKINNKYIIEYLFDINNEISNALCIILLQKYNNFTIEPEFKERLKLMYKSPQEPNLTRTIETILQRIKDE